MKQHTDQKQQGKRKTVTQSVTQTIYYIIKTPAQWFLANTYATYFIQTQCQADKKNPIETTVTVPCLSKHKIS